MRVMEPQEASINIFDMNYPCYVSPIPNGDKIVHIPGLFEYKYLDEIFSYVVEGYKVENKIYLYDAIPHNLWIKQVCKIPYEKRLKDLRGIIFGQINKPEVVLDLETVLIENPAEFLDYCANLLSQGFKKVKIMDVSGEYIFGKCCEEQYLEYSL